MHEEQNEQEHLIKAARQRAGVMGLIGGLLKEDKDLSLTEVKQRIVSIFSLMIELDMMVNDVIDMEVATACKEFLEQEGALEEVRDLIK